MMHHFRRPQLRNSIRMCKTTQAAMNTTTSKMGFASKTRDDISLNAKWLAMAEKESRGKFNVREKLIRETNE